MNPFPVDAYAYANRLHAAHPGEKLLFAGLTMGVALAAGSPIVAAAGFALACLAATRMAGIPLVVFLRFVRLPLGFVLAGALSMAVSVVDPSAALASLPVGRWQVGVAPAGLSQAVRVFGVSAACIAAGTFLALTTPVADIGAQLRRWRVPGLFVELLLLVYRFVFVLVETAQSIHLAQEARLGYVTRRRTLHSVGLLVSSLLVRALARADALFTALSARGYTGRLDVLDEEFAWSRRNLGLVAAAAVAQLAFAIATRLGGLP
ncbi:MAG TPA: cobalt ECF transporter T component CbiQ [Chloroflexota bacterium]|nr:cobalt ECF transporter T component CbiQ [Chloroflexota bacterium]